MRVTNHRFPGVYVTEEEDRKYLATKSLTQDIQSFYGERVVKVDQDVYRQWSPRRSKLSAAIQNGLRELPIQPGSRVLYLGAASGTTVSHVSDVVGETGLVAAVEFSAKTARGLLRLAGLRSNVVPIVEDARHPSRYTSLLTGTVDVVYQDVAQPDQARILSDNLRTFCSFGSWGMIAIKARSIDSASDASQVIDREITNLDLLGLEVVEEVNLEPFEKDHMMVTVRVR
ncbi:MAG: fibrillarin-like rRNA/tRNA 2'-O-methyltransferase [Candidatus Thorarchaeota archaeon]|nr:fibrillarin-like rRNA/tRNA 2'-O-methyltransferase [Candidatus Thorarchaeota archaeon]